MKKIYVIPQILVVRTEIQKLMIASDAGPGANDQSNPTFSSGGSRGLWDVDDENDWDEEYE
jgi:hypothetical protein